MKLGFIYNPASGRGKAQDFRETFQHLLTSSGVEFISFESKYPGHVQELVENLGSHGIFHFVACGGDGTINEVASTLVNKKEYFLGILPLGCGNDYCRNFKIPLNPSEALNMIINNKFTIKPSDCGSIWNKYFFNTLSFGFDASVAHHSSKRKVSENLYSATAKKRIFLHKHHPLSITVDNKRIHDGDVFFLNISNGKTYGCGVPISPTSDISDGLLNVTLLENAPVMSRPFLLNKVQQGTHVSDSSFKFYKCRNITVESNEKIDAQVDGLHFELEHKAEIKILPQALNILSGS